MSIEEMERRFHELKAKFNAGALSLEQLESEIAKLHFQDAQNRWWMIGVQSGNWYWYDGSHWIAAQPPAEPIASSPSSEWSRPAARPAAHTKDPAALPPAARSPAPAVPRLGSGRDLFRSSSALLRLIIVECIALVAVGSVLFMLWNAGGNLNSGESVGDASEPVTLYPSGAALPAPLAAPPLVNDNNIAAVMAAADKLVSQGQLEDAIAQYETAARMAPSSPAPLSHESRVLGFRGQMHNALAKAHQATQRAPNDAEAQAQLARALAWSGPKEDYDPIPDALTAAQKAVELDPKSATAHAYLAEIYLLVKRPADAERQARQALDLAPQSAEAHRSLAWVLTLAGQKDAALAEWRQTVALEPQLFFRHFELGEVLRVFFHDPVTAISEYQTAVALNGVHVPSYTGLGLAYLDARQPQNAVAQFQRAKTLDPDKDAIDAYLGLALGQSNQCSKAIPYFKSVLERNANHSIAAKGLAECQSGKLPSALVFPAPTTPLIPPSLDPKLD